MKNFGKYLTTQLNNSIPSLTMVIFFRQLSTLISSQIPIIQGLTILYHTQSHKIFRQILMKIKIDIEAGHAFSICLSKYPQYFDTFTRHLISTGEQSGTLAFALDRIALHKENLLAIKAKIKRAFIYPAIVLIVALCVTLIMLTIVIPRFAELFKNMHSDLPAFTRTIIYVSDFIRSDYWIFAFPLIVIIFLLHCVKRSPFLQYQIERLGFQLPYFGTLYIKLILSRFCRSLATTYTAGIPISESLNMIAYANGSSYYAQIILKLRSQITKGQQLHQAMQRQLFFPHLLTTMIKIGEESGTLDKMLEKIANIYESEIDHELSICSQMLEPLIIAILGVLIGGLVIAMYLPIFKLGTAI